MGWIEEGDVKEVRFQTYNCAIEEEERVLGS